MYESFKWLIRTKKFLHSWGALAFSRMKEFLGYSFIVTEDQFSDVAVSYVWISSTLGNLKVRHSDAQIETT